MAYLPPEQRVFAVIENKKIINIIVGVEDEVVAKDPEKYIEFTYGWDFDRDIDTNGFMY